MKVRFNCDKPVAIVIGLGINGLGTVRALGRRGIPVIAICSGDRSLGEYTRYCTKVVCHSLTEGGDELLKCLGEIGRDLSTKAVLFPSSDFDLFLISEHRELLADYFYFPFPDRETVRLLIDKVKFYKFAIQNGFPIAKTYFPDGLDDVKKIAKGISYPCLIKPSFADYEWRKHGLKVLEARTEEDLINHYKRAYSLHRSLVIQEVIPGPDRELFFSLTYFNKQCIPVAMFTGRKLRQYVPRYGISSMAESLWRPEIAKRSISLLTALKYFGYGSVEFKRDTRSGECYITEVTMRTWYPHALSTYCGINLPYIIYRDLLGLEIQEQNYSFREGVKWIDEVGDLKSAYQYWKEGEMTLMGWARSYTGKKTYAVLAWDDPLPFLILAYRWAFTGLKKIGKLFLMPSKGVRSKHPEYRM